MQFIFKNLHLFSRFPQKLGQTNYGVKPFEIEDVISIKKVCAQQTILKLKPFIYVSSRVFLSVFLTSTSALFFPIR